MSIFSKKVRFVQMGLFIGFECVCGAQDEPDPDFTVMDYGYVRADEIVPGYTDDDLSKCGACGAIFVGFRYKHAGKIVGRGKSYDQELAEGMHPWSVNPWDPYP